MDAADGIAQGSTRASLIGEEGIASASFDATLEIPLASLDLDTPAHDHVAVREISLGKGAILRGAELVPHNPIISLPAELTVYLTRSEDRIPFTLNPAASIASKSGDAIRLPAGTQITYHTDNSIRIESDTIARSDSVQVGEGTRRRTPFTDIQGRVSAGTVLSLTPIEGSSDEASPANTLQMPLNTGSAKAA